MYAFFSAIFSTRLETDELLEQNKLAVSNKTQKS